jgi:cation diffusion facilitator family transporter
MADQTPNEISQSEKMTAARLSLVSNAVLTLVKLAIGILTGSVSVLSEGAHSAMDLLASGLAFYTVRRADNPPDAEHPYGHGKMESLSALIQAVFLFGVGGYILYEAIQHLIRRAGPQRVDWGMGIMLLSAVVNVFIVRYMVRVARHTDSPALHAAAQDHRADIYTAIGVFIGLALVRVTGKSFFDPVLALCVALVIVHGAWEVVRGATSHLIDYRLPKEDVEIVQTVFDSEPSVLGYHKLRTRKAGSMRHIDAHVLMDDNLTLLQSHALTEQLEEKIRQVLPHTVVTLHTEPYHAELSHQHTEHGGPPPDQKIKRE